MRTLNIAHFEAPHNSVEPITILTHAKQCV